MRGPLIGNENSARSFPDRSFFEPAWGHGRPCLRVMDVRTDMLVFPGFRGLDLRHFLPVQLGLRENFKILRKIARNLCTHILGSPTTIFCANCAGAPPHKFRTISAHFRMPPHIFRTNFLGSVGNVPRTSFAQFSWAHGLFSKSGSVQAMNVSRLDRSFCPRTSAGISAWTSAGYPAPRLALWADFPFLNQAEEDQE